ncbi:MAG: hypothetical protein IJR99_14895 [Kiritimatiellae bacterium]|nr:hypothetical protein [Kiritimatiellia bacterium]
MKVIDYRILLLVFVFSAAGSSLAAETNGTVAAAREIDPAKLEFKLLATRRFMLDNEVMLSEFVPGASARPSLQNPLMPYCSNPRPKLSYGKGAVTFSAPADVASEGVLFVGAFHPGVHFSADVQSLSEGGSALLCIAPYDGSFRTRVRAEPGKPVEFEQTWEGKKLAAKLDRPQVVPPPPFRLSAIVAGPTILIAVRKDNDVRYLGSVSLVEDPEIDIRRRDFAGKLKCAAGAWLPPGGKASLSRAAVTLTAGVGQADFRIVTDGPSCRPYLENGRIFCTFSARAGLKYTKSVASFNPSVFDFRMEGILLTSYGDDDPLLRNDGVGHVFRDKDGTWKATAVGWSTTTHDLTTRRGSGLVACETRENPLHGIHVLRAKPLVVGSGIKSEDAYVTFDAATNKWRLATSSFGKGLRARLWESDNWDGPYAQIAGPVEFDSTGCEIMDFGGRKYVMTANVDRKRPIYEYPSLKYVGELKLDFDPYNKECSNGRIFMAFAELPEGFPYRYILLTMDRQNFPGMPSPNWTYGAMYLYGANP